MHPDMDYIRCSIIRGGTSKGVYFLSNDLPADPDARDRLILSVFGGVDPRQIDGLGGADPLTSKVAIVGPSTRPDCDVDYTFGQVSFAAPCVDYKGNCGNISAGVGPFAIDRGLVRAVEPITTVRIHLTNTDNVIVAEVPVRQGRALTQGGCAIAGVPGTGAAVTLDFSDTQGAVTGRLLPTGHPTDVLDLGPGGRYEVSIVDAGNPLVFLEAAALGLSGTETPAQIEENAPLMERIETIRGRAAALLGLCSSGSTASLESPYIPFFAIVSPPADYDCYNGLHVGREEVDVVSRLLFMQKMHKTYPGTGTVCTGAAACIPGSVLSRQLPSGARGGPVVRIGHPAGVIEVQVEAASRDAQTVLTRAAFTRTARTLMEGLAYVPRP